MELYVGGKRGILKKALMSVCIAVLLLFVYTPRNIYATAELLSATGELDTEEEKSFNFELPVKSKVTISFIGLDGNKGTFGDFTLKIIDSSDKVVFEEWESSLFDDINMSTTLSEGKYTLVLQEDGFDTFEYYFSIKAVAIGKVPTKTLKLDTKNIVLSKEKSYNLDAKYTPVFSSDKLTWSSSNKKVATVDKLGKVTGKNLGKTTITAKMGKKKAKCTVYVTSTYIEINKGKSKNLSSTIKNIPKYKNAKWKSSNKSVATVSKTGKIKALKHGKTTISAKISGKKYSITVYVYDHNVLVREAKSKLKSILKNPNSLIINNTLGKGNYVSFDYSAMNGLGGYNRNTFSAWYDKGVIQYITY